MSKKKGLSERIASKVDRIKNHHEDLILDRLVDQTASIKVIQEIIEGCIPAFTSKIPVRPHKVNVSKINRELVLKVSDVHLGAKLPGYDWSTFKRRLNLLLEKVEALVFEKSIRKVHLLLDGDIVDGDSIYPGHQNHICMSAAQQAIEGAKEIADFLLSLSSITELEVHCVGGNHGRPGRKGEATYKENWDLILCSIMKVHLKHTNIKITISESWFNMVDVQGIKIFSIHGDDIGNGEPISLLSKSLPSWRLIHGHFDVCITGHYHKPVLGVDVCEMELFINGAFSGSQEYNERKLKTKSKTGQIAFVVDNGEITDRILIGLA